MRVEEYKNSTGKIQIHIEEQNRAHLSISCQNHRQKHSPHHLNNKTDGQCIAA